MSLRRWLLPLGTVALLVIAGCPSAMAPVAPTSDDTGGSPDGGTLVDGGALADGGAPVDGGESGAGTDGGAATAPTLDGGVPHAQSGSDGGNAETSQQKAENAKRAAEAEQTKAEAEAKKEKSVINARLKDASQFAVSGNDSKAISAFQGVLKDYPKAYVAHYDLGVLYDRMGDVNRAIGEYEAAIQAKPDFGPANANLDRLYIRSGRLEDAEDNAQRIPSNGKSVVAQNQIVRVLIAKGDLAGAEALAKKVLKIDERNINALLSLGEIWYQEKKLELARQVLDNARAIDPNAAEVWNLEAFVYLGLEEKDLALKAFTKAASLREDFPEAHNNLGAMLNESNDCKGAIRELELAVRYAPGYSQAHLNLGNAYRCDRRFTDAESEYEKALALDPKSKDAVFNLAILFLDGNMKMKWDTGNDLDSDRLERLKKAKAYFDQYRAAGGDDDRLDRYYAETQKDIDKENERLARVEVYNKKKREIEEKRKAQAEADKKAQEAKEAVRKAALAKRIEEINAQKVEGKSDIVDEAPAPPSPAPAPATVAVAPGTGETQSTVAALPAPQPEVVAPAPAEDPHRPMKKIAPMEDEPDSGP